MIVELSRELGTLRYTQTLWPLTRDHKLGPLFLEIEKASRESDLSESTQQLIAKARADARHARFCKYYVKP
jgi:hypothetical protein